MSRIDVVIRGAGVVVVAGVLATGEYVVGGGGEGVTANLFVVASGGSPSCVRSTTPVAYDAADDANAICGPGTGNVGFNATAFDNACDAASAGDIVGVKNGSYGRPANGALMESGEDCAPGAGDYNPNWKEQGASDPTSNLANWTTYIPADDPQAITFVPNRFYFFGVGAGGGNYHMIWKDIDVNTGMQMGSGGEEFASQRVENIIIRGNSASDHANIHGIQLIGARNVMFKHLDYGPSTQCGKDDPNVPAAFRCSSSAPWWESQYANFGTASAGCTPIVSSICGGWFEGGTDWVEMYIHDIKTEIPYLNVRVEDVINHDQQGKQDGAGVHPGCLMTWDSGNNPSAPSHNLVLDHYECFRPTGASVQFGDSGSTIQNSVFGCQVQSLQNTGGLWDGPCVGSPFGLSQKVSANNLTNVLIRYNTFIGNSNGGSNVAPFQINNSGVFDPDISNVRVVGNLFIGGNPTCGISGVTYSTNTYTNGATSCESDGTATVLGAGDPIVDSSYDLADGSTPDENGSAFDPSADGSPALTDLNPTSRNTACGCTDYTLDHDFEGDARSSTATKPGADG